MNSDLEPSFVTGFRPRDPREAVRNCSHVDQVIRNVIVDTLTQHLLQTENYVVLNDLDVSPDASPLNIDINSGSTSSPHKELSGNVSTTHFMCPRAYQIYHIRLRN